MIKTEKFKDFDVVVSLPDGYEEGKKYPLIIFLHGAGSRGRNISLLSENPFFSETSAHHLQAVVVAPQCYRHSWFALFQELQDFALHYSRQTFVEQDRVYLMGSSMGGYGTWELAMTLPNLFAAIIPICGGGLYAFAERLKGVPVWAFHGTEDKTVFPQESISMVNAINKKGGNAKLTLCEGVGHCSWLVAYRDKAVFDWLFAQRKGKTIGTQDSCIDQTLYG